MKIKTIAQFSIAELNQIAIRIARQKIPQFKEKNLRSQFTEKDGFVGIEVQEDYEEK